MNNKPTTKSSLRKLVLGALISAPMMLLPSSLWALPVSTAGNLTSSNTSTVPQVFGTTLTITAPDKTVLKWGEFGSGASTFVGGETIDYRLPSASSAILNVVTGGAASNLGGAITSNGSVFILNTAGIVVGATATFNVAGLTLSTVPEPSDLYFVANGNLSYVGTATAPITITAGASITSASGSGNVLVAAKGVNIAGRIDAGKLETKSFGAATNLGSGGNLLLGMYGSKSVDNVVTDGVGTLVVDTAGGALSFANQVEVRGGLATLTTTSTSANGSITQVGNLIVNDTQTRNSVTIAAGTGTVNFAGIDTKTVTVNAGATTIIQTGAAVPGAASTLPATIGATGNDLVVPAGSTVAGNLVLSSAAGAINATVDVTGTGSTISLTNFAIDKNITFVGNGDLVFAALATHATDDNTISVTSNTGSITLPSAGTSATAIGAGNNSNFNLSAKAATNITQTAGTKIATRNTVTMESVGGLIDLTSAGGNTIDKLVLKGAPNGAKVISNSNNVAYLSLNSGTNVLGAAEITGNSIRFGSNASDSVAFGSTLKVTATGVAATDVGIIDATNLTNVYGALTLNSAKDIVLNGNADNGVLLGSKYGQINITSAINATIFEAGTLNLGAISTSGILTAYSSTGSIINTGQLKVVGNAVFGSGTELAPGTINLDYSAAAGSGNQIATGAGSKVFFLDDISLLTKADPSGVLTAAPATVGALLVKDATIVNEGTLNFGLLKSVYGTGVQGNLTVTTLSAGSDIVFAGNTAVTGTLTLTAPDQVTASAGGINNMISTVTVNAGGTVNVVSGAAMTANANLVEATAGSTALFRSYDALNIGTYSSTFTGLTTFRAGNGSSARRAITDGKDGIFIYGDVYFQSDGAVTINNLGHSFGKVQVSTGGDNSAVVTESGTLNINAGGVNVGKGSLTLTSSNGDILQSGVLTVNVNSSASNTLTLNAPNGKVTLGSNNAVDNGVAINLTAKGDSAIIQKNKDILLGNITVTEGKFLADLGTNSTVNGYRILQKAGTKINVYGDVTLLTVGAAPVTGGDIILENTGNRMGGINANAGTANISIKESATLNIKNALAGGSLTLASENGDIISTTDTSLVSNVYNVAGAVSFNAPKGSVTASLAGSNFGGDIAIITKGDALVLDTVGGTTLGAGTNVGGALTVRNTAGGTIGQSGAINVTGNVLLDAGAGSINLSNSGNMLGGIRFIAGAGGAIIAESTTLNLLGGSLSTGPVSLSTGGDFITTGPGGASITSSLTISATGTIKPGAGSLLVTGLLTVFSNAEKDLSNLSRSGNLVGNYPINLGTGTYKGPND